MQQTHATVNQQVVNAEPPQEVRESAKMLIVLENGEQRLITFTLPKESCTVQELLEQIGIPFEADTNIHCLAKPGHNIDYLVTVGVNMTENPNEIVTAAENSLQMKQQEQQVYQTISQPVQSVNNHMQAKTQTKVVVKTPQGLQHYQKVQVAKPNVTITQKTAVPAKYVYGFFALCAACGYTSQNHAQCQR